MRKALSFVEIMVVAVVLALVLALFVQALSTVGRTFFAGNLNHAVQGAALVMAELEADLRQAARDPRTGAAVVVDGNAVSFHRLELTGGRGTLVPVRWFIEGAALKRSVWDVAAGKYVTRAVPAVRVDAGAGLVVRTEGPLVSVSVTVLARDRRHSGVAGGAQDAVVARTLVNVPYASQVSARFCRIAGAR